MHPFRHTDVGYEDENTMKMWEVGKLARHCVNGTDSQPFSHDTWLHLELYSLPQTASFVIPNLHNLWAAVGCPEKGSSKEEME